MTIDQHIEELRAELKACPERDEIVQIEGELIAALDMQKRFDDAFERTLGERK